MGSDRVWAIRAERVLTLDPERPRVEALAVRAGRVLATGSARAVGSRVGRDLEWVDARPAVITPGLSDSHIHLLEWSLTRRAPDLGGARTQAEALRIVAETAARHPLDAWLEFRGWDPALRRQGTLEELDGASGGRAVALISHDLHSGWLNSEAMSRLEITSDRSDPPGGELERDSSGRPTGVVFEEALSWWHEARPEPDPAERRRALEEGQAVLHRLGVTAVHSVEGRDSFVTVQDLERRDALRLRVLQHVPYAGLDAVIETGLTSGFGSRWLRIGGVKIFTDGALGSRTAWMLEPYLDTGERGIRRLDPEELRLAVHRAARAGLAATIHAIGDAAVRMTLDALESVGGAGPEVPHRIEHLQCVHPDDLPRAARAGIVASMQPAHLLTDIPLAERAWGEARNRGVYAFRSLLDAGTILAFGSDAPVEGPDPREGFYAALARRDRSDDPAEGWFPEERLTGMEILSAYTVGAARAAGDLERRGRLRPGDAADFVAWTGDLTEARPDEIRSIEPIMTVVDGEVRYRR